MPELPVDVLVVDQTMVAQGLSRLIDEQADLRVVGVAGTGAAGVRGVRQWRPAVVVMGDRLPDTDGVAVLAHLAETAKESKVVLLTSADHQRTVRTAVSAGCAAVVAKSQPVKDLLAVIRQIHHNGSRVAPLSGPAVNHGLSVRQLEVLALLGEGADTEQIARELYISPNTVRNHVQRIIRQLGVHSRLEAVTSAIRQGIISAP